ERAELVERPRVQRGPLGPAKPDPAADAREVFQGDPTAGACGHGHDALRNDGVGVGGDPGLLAAATTEQALGRLGALGLELGPQPPVAVADPVQLPAGGPGAVASGGD